MKKRTKPKTPKREDVKLGWIREAEAGTLRTSNNTKAERIAKLMEAIMLRKLRGCDS